MKDFKKLLEPAVRQFRHNDGSEGFVLGLDYDKVMEILSNDEFNRSEQAVFDRAKNNPLDLEGLLGDVPNNVLPSDRIRQLCMESGVYTVNGIIKYLDEQYEKSRMAK